MHDTLIDPFLKFSCFVSFFLAVHGFSPPLYTKSAKDFVVYYSSVLVFSRDEKGNYIKCPWKKVATYGFSFLCYLVLLGLLKSLLIQHENMMMFGPSMNSRLEWFSIERFATWELYANNAFQACTCSVISLWDYSLRFADIAFADIAF
jgi:hypothetical protein